VAVSVVDATGAGDAFTAALIAGLAGQPWPPDASVLAGALADAAALAAEVAGTVGAQARVGSEGAG
jgi:sugar/nucleoside kinase (ribokinase family)